MLLDLVSWFTGILEGEGTFVNIPNGRPIIQISNTDKDIIDRCKEFLDNNLILSEIYDVKARERIKKSYVIHITRVNCNNLYKLVKFEMECRLSEFQLILGIQENVNGLLDKSNISWLIGIWEAEGSIGIANSNSKRLQPILNLPNTNNRIIEKVINNLYNLDCSWYTYKHNDDGKPKIQIAIHDLPNCKRFLTKLKGLWLSDRNIRRSHLLLEFVTSRLKAKPGARYSDREWDIYHELCFLNS